MTASAFDMNSLFRDLQIRDSGLRLLRKPLRRQRLLRLALDSRREVASGHRGPLTCAHLDASTDSLLLTGSIDKTVALYDIKALDRDEAVKIRASKTSNAFLAERAAATAVAQSAGLGPPMGHEYGVSSAQWYPADPGVFISSSFDQRVLLWDTETFQPVTHFEVGTPVTSARMRVQPDDILIAVAADTSSIVLLDVLSGAATHRLPGHTDFITCVEWSPTNPYLLASGARNGAVRLFDVRRSGGSACLLTLDWMQDHTATQTGVWYRRIDPKGDAIAKAHASSVSSVAFTGNGQTLLTAGAEEQLRTWDVESGLLHTSAYHGAQISKKPAPMTVVDDLVFLPSTANHEVVAFDIFGRDGSPLTQLAGHFADVTAVCVRESAQQLITTSTDGLIFVWSHNETRTVREEPLQQATPRRATTASYGSGFLGRSSEQSYDVAPPARASTTRAAEDEDAWSSDDEHAAGRFVPPIVDAYLRNPRTRLAQAVARHGGARNALYPVAPAANGGDDEWLRESMPLYDPSFQSSGSSSTAAAPHESATSSATVANSAPGNEEEAGGFIPEGIAIMRVGGPGAAQSQQQQEQQEQNSRPKRRISIRAKLTKKMKPHNRIG